MTEKKPPKAKIIPITRRVESGAVKSREICGHDERLRLVLPRLSEELPLLGADIKKIRARIIAIGNQEFDCDHKPKNNAARDRLIVLNDCIEDLEAIYNFLDAQLLALFIELH